jgi:CHASE2 domain-containing sensor protein
VMEDPDGVLRRYLFSMTPTMESPCHTEVALSLQLAQYYLQNRDENIEIKSDPKTGEIKLGDRIIPLVTSHWGGYQGNNDGGYQMMLNYRTPPVTRSVTLRQILANDFDPRWIEGKIILIGVTAPTVKDFMFTPYSTTRQTDQKMFGVLVQAQMTSQMISAVLDHRPFISAWTIWQDGMWMLVWCYGLGLILESIIKKPMGYRSLILIVGVTAIIVWVNCFVILSSTGVWLPMIPTLLSAISSVVLHSLTKFRFKAVS